jgi:hypothetical protein
LAAAERDGRVSARGSGGGGAGVIKRFMIVPLTGAPPVVTVHKVQGSKPSGYNSWWLRNAELVY